jgi:hypothetical protein
MNWEVKMNLDYKTYKLIKSLRPIDLYEIITRGTCSEYTEEIKKQIIETKGKWFLDNWGYNNTIGTVQVELSTLDLYISDTGFELFTTKEDSLRLKEIFNSWNIFYNVYSKWYGGNNNYKVGFSYDYNAFNQLYKEWLRDKKLTKLLINTHNE